MKTEAPYKDLFQQNNRNLYSWLVKWEMSVMI